MLVPGELCATLGGKVIALVESGWGRDEENIRPESAVDTGN